MSYFLRGLKMKKRCTKNGKGKKSQSQRVNDSELRFNEIISVKTTSFGDGLECRVGGVNKKNGS